MCVYLSVCLTIKPLPIVTEFGINVSLLGTKAERRICKDFFSSLPFHYFGRYWTFFLFYGRRSRSNVLRTILVLYNNIDHKLKKSQ